MQFDALEKRCNETASWNCNIVIDTSIQRLLKMKKFIFKINACTPIDKQSIQD